MIAIRAEPIRVVFFGTPAYAVPALEALATDPRVTVSLVVTQPDRPAGRGHKLLSPPVKRVALDYNLPVYQPPVLRTEEDRRPIAAASADLFIVAAFGRIFGPKLLALPPLGSVNLHASLLPRYRGASPISAAILTGERQTGITLMRMDEGLDTGDILAQRTWPINEDATTASLTIELARLGAELLSDSIEALSSESLRGDRQPHEGASLTRPLVKADGWIEWTQPAEAIERQVRAMWDWPRCWTSVQGETLQIHRAGVVPGSLDEEPGIVVERDGWPIVSTGAGGLSLELVQRAGDRPRTGSEWLRQSGLAGETLGSSSRPAEVASPIVRPVGA